MATMVRAPGQQPTGGGGGGAGTQGWLDEWQCGSCGALNPPGPRTWCMRCHAPATGGIPSSFATAPTGITASDPHELGAHQQRGKERGTVARWFEEKGFGFITPQGRENEEVFVHRSAFGNESSLAVGGEIWFDIQRDPSGKLRATNAGGAAVCAKGAAPSRTRNQDSAVPAMAGRGAETGNVCKWYEDKGFGFVEHDTCFGKDELFVHRTSLSGDSSLGVGLELRFDITIDSQGKIRATNCSGPAIFPRGEAKDKEKEPGEGPVEEGPQPEPKKEPKQRSQVATEWDRQLLEAIATERQAEIESYTAQARTDTVNPPLPPGPPPTDDPPPDTRDDDGGDRKRQRGDGQLEYQDPRPPMAPDEDADDQLTL